MNIFKYKNKINELERICNDLDMYNKNMDLKYRNILKNIISIINNKSKNLYSVDLYEKKNKYFLEVIYFIEAESYRKDICIEIYLVSDERIKKVTCLYSYIYIYNNKKDIKISSLDTYSNHNQGHASRCIKSLIDYANQINATKISGGLFLGNHDLDEKLRNFYRKNGFEVDKASFTLNLIEED